MSTEVEAVEAVVETTTTQQDPAAIAAGIVSRFEIVLTKDDIEAIRKLSPAALAAIKTLTVGEIEFIADSKNASLLKEARFWREKFAPTNKALGNKTTQGKTDSTPKRKSDLVARLTATKDDGGERVTTPRGDIAILWDRKIAVVGETVYEFSDKLSETRVIEKVFSLVGRSGKISIPAHTGRYVVDADTMASVLSKPRQQLA